MNIVSFNNKKEEYKLSQDEFRFFCKRCRYYMEVLGLRRWKVYYAFDSLEGERGSCTVDVSGGVATITLSRVWEHEPSKEAIDQTAKHEMLHLLFGRLRANAGTRFIGEAEVVESIHEIIRVFEKLI
jgi:hypothetical protein